MTKLLLNTGGLLHDQDGRPVAPGAIVLSDEMENAAELEEEGVLVHVKPSELPENLDDALLSAAAIEHLSGNAEPAVGDDAPVSPSTRTRRGGQS